jgi:sensor histidine kinase regulating citrate/malate metabolism
LILKVSNTIEDNILDQDGNIKRKEYSKGHGFGMYSIKKTVDKYDGIINLAEENHNFCCGIVFFGE